MRVVVFSDYYLDNKEREFYKNDYDVVSTWKEIGLLPELITEKCHIEDEENKSVSILNLDWKILDTKVSFCKCLIITFSVLLFITLK